MKLWKTVAKMDPRAKVWPRPDVLVRISNKLQRLQLMLGPSRGASPALYSVRRAVGGSRQLWPWLGSKYIFSVSSSRKIRSQTKSIKDPKHTFSELPSQDLQTRSLGLLFLFFITCILKVLRKGFMTPVALTSYTVTTSTNMPQVFGERQGL